ncbi:hypothetical protein [Sinobaca sp. H24]|uniref:hypothetical protein n=1 Tax=Sinobaca sp. H24 TaxID=2923376 RepID=UPI00207A27CF|nr:hypothetical protein [Sinobaca sp. H24]
MKIQTVLYKNESLSEEISIEAIEYHKDFEIVRKKLYCTFQGCGAKIEYVPKGKHKAYFKTWPRQDHIEECVDYFEREKKRKSEKGSATLDVALTPSHINRVLREIYKEANENEEDKRNRIEKQKNKSKKKNITVDESQLPSSSVNINPTTEGGKNDLKVGQRAPNVRKRHNIQLLSESDIGFTRAVYGIVQSIIIEKDRVIFKISSGNKRM